MASKKSEEIAGFKLFGKSTGDIRHEAGVPEEFKVEAFFDVPLDKIPRSYLYAFIDGIVFEARKLRAHVEAAIKRGEEERAADAQPVQEAAENPPTKPE